MNKAYFKAINEGGEGYTSFDSRYPAEPTEAEQDASLAVIRAELAAQFDAEWTLEVTKARRAAWNDAIKSGEYPGAIQKRLGFGPNNLRDAIKKHGI